MFRVQQLLQRLHFCIRNTHRIAFIHFQLLLPKLRSKIQQSTLLFLPLLLRKVVEEHYLLLEEGFKDTYSRLRWNVYFLYDLFEFLEATAEKTRGRENVTKMTTDTFS